MPINSNAQAANVAPYQSVRRNAMVLPTAARRGMRRRARLVGFENITDSAHSPNHFVGEVLIYFVSQPADEDIHNVGLRIDVVAPDMLHNHRLGEHAVSI